MSLRGRGEELGDGVGAGVGSPRVVWGEGEVRGERRPRKGGDPGYQGRLAR